MSTSDAFEPGQPYEDQATSFGSAADVYERGRPTYPAEAVEWLLPEGAQNVVDLGAGTGKLTRLLVERVPFVTAIEPSAGMRDQLIRNVPGAQVLPGSAERLPLDGESADAILAAQAWHWVDPVRAVPEVARVLKPGGVLGLLWNIRQGESSWYDSLESILASAPGSSPRDLTSESPTVGDPFLPIERRDFRWVLDLTPDAALAMVASRSYVITLPDQDRETLLDEVRVLLSTHPDTAGRSVVQLPYVTRCSRAILPA